MTATATEHTAQLPAPLRPRPDQPERWIAHAQPVPFEEAAQLVLDAHAADGERDDVVAHDLRTWAFGSNDGRTMQLAPVPLPGRAPSEPIALRDLAFTQLAQRIGAPPGYVRTLPGRLQMACVNYGLTQTKQPALLRLAGGEVRAVVSDRYAAIDDGLLLDVVGDVLDKTGYLHDAVVRATSVGLRTVLRITVPNDGIAIKPGDVIEHGVDVSNSECGIRSVQITPVTYRLVCSNGARAWASEAALRLRHIGDAKRLKEQLRDAVPVAFAEARGDIERWRRATDVLIDNALDEVESLRAFGLGQAEVQAVGRQIMDSGALLPASTGNESLTQLLSVPTTAYDMANAITATARDRTDVASRLTLEEVAHRYLTRRTA